MVREGKDAATRTSQQLQRWKCVGAAGQMINAAVKRVCPSFGALAALSFSTRPTLTLPRLAKAYNAVKRKLRQDHMSPAVNVTAGKKIMRLTSH
ncbi:hypothetical protein RvY_11241 [Ramazzottius varieornatus]|uniref:Uncharacterized protein n=1 Tax=Ramazzottius varieornatus TaxID=947166 RepID=A0A1D1VJU6_RAMVA|nr:hypothetical protein RvY_11241 [Ramazzottius varieornatus]